jgi:hypothetical protein
VSECGRMDGEGRAEWSEAYHPANIRRKLELDYVVDQEKRMSALLS